MIKSLVILSTVLTLLTCQLSHAQNISTDKQYESLLDRFVDSGRFVSFPRTPVSKGNDSKWYHRGFKGESNDHPEGVFGSNEVMFSAKRNNTGLRNFSFSSLTDYIVLKDNARILTRDECLKNVDEITKLIWPTPKFKSGINPTPTIRDLNRGYEVFWTSYAPDLMHYRKALIHIRKVDGKCTAVYVDEYKWSENKKNKRLISYQKALTAATKLLKSTPEKSKAVLKSWTIDGFWSPTYLFNYELPKTKDNRNRTFPIYVSPFNGRAQFSLSTPSRWQVGDDYSVPDYHDPMWTKQGLIFYSSKFRQSFDDKKLYAKLILRDWSGKYSVLFAKYNGSPEVIFSAPWSDWIVFGNGGACALNIATGQFNFMKGSDSYYYGYNADVLNPALKNTQDESTNATSSIPFIAVTEGSGENQYFEIDRLDKPFPQNPHEKLSWKANLIPCFSPDGRFVYLYPDVSAPDVVVKSTPIYRMPVEKFLSTTSKNKLDLMKESQEVHRISGKFSYLKPYPEGNQLFVAASSDTRLAIIVDLEARRETRITAEAIQQKNAAVLSDVYQIFVGPKSGELLILAAGKQQKVNSLFVCNLDGSNLKQLTPDKETPVEYHRFPSGNSGFDVSKQIALRKRG